MGEQKRTEQAQAEAPVVYADIKTEEIKVALVKCPGCGNGVKITEQEPIAALELGRVLEGGSCSGCGAPFKLARSLVLKP